MQRAHHHVTGKGGLDGDTARFQVTDFADHDDVRILTEERLQCGSERHADLGAHLHLIDAEEIVLHGIFGGHDVGVAVVDLRQRRIQRSRLAGTGGAGHEDHAVRVRDRFHQLAFGARLDTELLEVEGEVALVENSEHDLLAEQRGQHTHTEVDDLPADLQFDAAVLRHASFGDVQRRHDLESRDQGRAHLEGRLHDFGQRTIDAIPHAQFMLEALEVNIRGALVYRVDEDGVDELHHRRFVDLRRQHTRVLRLFLRLQQLYIIFFGRSDVLKQRLHMNFVRFVVLLDRRAHRVLTGQHRNDVVAGDELEIVDHRHGGRIGNRHRQLSPVALEGQNSMLGRQLRRDQLEEARVDLEARQVDGRHTVLTGEHAYDFRFRHEAHLDDGQPDALARRGGLLLQRLCQLLTSQQPLFDEEIAEPFGGSTGKRCSRSSHGYLFRLGHVRRAGVW